MASLADMIRQKSNFKPDDSMIASAIMHPQQALGKVADWFQNNVNTGMGYADPYDNPNPLLAPSMEKQAEAGLNLAGLLQGGAFASGAAPKSAGGTLGTFAGISAKATEGLPVGMSIKNVSKKNLNKGLVDKYLQDKWLSYDDLQKYEKNALKMETPNLQRFNVENANANPEMEAYKNSLYDSFHGGRESKKYDGTIESAINGFDLSKGGMGSGNRDGKLGVFSTNDPFVASEFAENRNNPFVMPLKIRMDNPWQPENYKEISDLIDNHTQFKDSYKFPDGSNIRMVGDVINPEAARKELTDKGFDSVRLKNTLMDSIEGKPIDQYVSLDPKNIRSRFAAFDPLRKNSSSLLASLLGATALANEYDKNKKLKEMR